MTLGDYVYIVEANWHVSAIQIEADEGTLIQCINEAAQRLYPVMVAADHTIWVFRQTFTNTTTINYPANYGRTLLVEVPGARQGAARRFSFREWRTFLNNQVLAPTANSPAYMQDAAHLKVSPAVSGSHYYIRTFGEITDVTQELSAFGAGNVVLIPWEFEESLILGALHILAQRELGKPGVPENEAKKLFQLSDATKGVFDASRKQGTLWKETTIRPQFPVPQQQSE